MRYQNVSLFLAIVKKMSKLSIYDSIQARAKPWQTRLPTSDNNSLITKQIRTNETPKFFSNLGDCSGLSKEARRWNSRNQDISQLTVTYMLACVRLRIQKQAKKEDTKIPATIQLQEKAGKVHTTANTDNTIRALLL